MTNGFQSEVRFAHAADILFFPFKFMFLTYTECVSDTIFQTGYVRFVFEQEKYENVRLVIYKSSITKSRKLCYNNY